MIFDTLDHADQYAVLSPRIAAALAYLNAQDFARVAPGRYEIQGGDVFALVQEYEGKPFEEGFWETHRSFIDVQYLHAGKEKMGVAPLDSLRVKKQYDAEKDLLVLDGDGDFITLEPRQFTIFFPQDAHMPGLAAGGGKIKKIVVKVRV